MKHFSFILLVILSSCSVKKTELNLLQGNWYNLNLERSVDDELLSNYQEIYFSKQRIFYFSEISGFGTPKYYKIKSDSLYMSYHSNKNYYFSGKIILKNNKFSIIQIEDTINFYKLKNIENTLDKFLVISDSISDFHQKGTEFTQGFINRSKKNYSKE